MKGIVLLAVGKPSYMKFAYQQALSIKYHSPNIPIQLICEQELLSPLKDKWKVIFDEITFIQKEDAYRPVELKGRISEQLEPGFAKLNIYKYLKYDESIYFDVDGICITDVNPLFKECKKDIHAQVVSTVDETAEKWKCQWMPLENVKKHYELPKEFRLPEINSSFMFIRKSKEAENFYKRALGNFRTDIPQKDFGMGWGARFPDELALNIAFAQERLEPSFSLTKEPDFERVVPIYFRTSGDKGNNGKPDPLAEIAAKHYVIGVFGSYKFNHSSIVGTAGYYDKCMQKYSKELMQENIAYKIYNLMQDKHVTNKK